MPTSAQIRRQYIDYFKQRHAHHEVPSSPVVPHDDPTLLFTNAGMNQFKDVFLGTGVREYTRAVDTQKCIRAGGKHNDLEDVGKDTYHHTFFEMLGNWSFGDYFKREAIAWAWDLLTNVWGLDKDRLHATVFGGDESDGLPADEEAAKLWREVTDIAPDHIHYGSKKDNFWEMGETGPCGPCSEIHIDRTSDKSGAGLVNGDDARVIEIWNLVFIEYNRTSAGKLVPLPAKHVDTGMGFERICAVLQNKPSNYDTDVFTPLFTSIAQVTGARPYDPNRDEPTEVAYRIIADHIRCLTFALTDGAVPSNEGRGYVLRRILRRAVRHGRQTLGVHEPFLFKLAKTVIQEMSGAFPELHKHPDRVKELIEEEEISFHRTLDRGIALFQQAADKGSGSGGQQISGDDAFTLYDTYGFPLDLTQVMAQERGMSVGLPAFDALMDQARQRSRLGGTDGTVDARQSLVEIVQQHDLPATKFIGYDQLELGDHPTPVALFRHGQDGYLPADHADAGDHVAVVVDTTPFYAEAGGQVGDTGEIIIQRAGPSSAPAQSASLTITDTVKVGLSTFHLGKVASGRIHAASTNQAVIVTLKVDAQRRAAIAANHTTTHVMNRALRALVNPDADQKGSLVDEHKLRFDFSHGKPVTREQIEQVQQQVNDDIAANLPVYCETAPQEQARQIHGLRAVFGEKYPPNVRIVAIGVEVSSLLSSPDNDKWPGYSIEFCGGTHLTHTGQAEDFVIISEEGVAKGVRRITAFTGQPARQARTAGQHALSQLNGLLDAKETDYFRLAEQIGDLSNSMSNATLPAAVNTKLREGIAELQATLKKLDKQRLDQAQADVTAVARAVADRVDGPIIVESLGEVDSQAMRKAVDVIQAAHPDSALLLAGVSDGKVSLIAAVPQGLIERGLKAGDWVREAAKIVGGGGGGRPELAQAGGKDADKIEEALCVAIAFAQDKLAADKRG